MAKFQFDESSLKQSLQAIVGEIHDTNDPAELNELRRIFRKYVPLFSRAYVAAYLLARARIPGAGDPITARPRDTGRDQKDRKESREPRENREFREQREPREVREPREARETREPKEVREPRETRDRKEAKEVRDAPVRENMTTLFIGIGRTRRVYPRDLMALLVENSGVEKDAIGNIKILDNYSFVDISNERAQAVIDSLNNTEYRGRTLSVNFAKKKD